MMSNNCMYTANIGLVFDVYNAVVLKAVDES